MYKRRQIFIDAGDESLFLWGARQTGKSTLLKSLYKDSLYFDLLLSDEFERLQRNPSILREMVIADPGRQPVIIDEIQLIPALLNEVNWLITNKNTRFILSGSSPRKILRSGANLLGGRALRYELYPFVSSEIPGFDLTRALNHGMLPRHYLASRAWKLLSADIGSYLRDEIMAEAEISGTGKRIIRLKPLSILFTRSFMLTAVIRGLTIQLLIGRLPGDWSLISCLVTIFFVRWGKN